MLKLKSPYIKYRKRKKKEMSLTVDEEKSKKEEDFHNIFHLHFIPYVNATLFDNSPIMRNK